MRAELNTLLSTLTAAERADEGIEHALQVRLAIARRNYTRLFELYHCAPKMGGYLIDHFAPRERLSALVAISRSYQTIPLEFVASQLGFESADEADAFLVEHTAAFYNPPSGRTLFDARDQPAGQRQFHATAAREALSAALATLARTNIKVRSRCCH